MSKEDSKEDAELDEDFFEDELKGSNALSSGFEPQVMDAETFRQRNDPKPLIDRFRLMLMNAYIVEREKKEDGKTVKITQVKRKKNTKPKANKEGVEGILRYIENYINSHVVQGNIITIEEFNTRMRYFSMDLTMHFLAKRKDWGILINDVDEIIATSVNLIDLFLTRTLFNEERKSYGETFRETRDISSKGDEKLPLWQRFGGFLSGVKPK